MPRKRLYDDGESTRRGKERLGPPVPPLTKEFHAPIRQSIDGELICIEEIRESRRDAEKAGEHNNKRWSQYRTNLPIVRISKFRAVEIT
jgi:hypothetical protein